MKAILEVDDEETYEQALTHDNVHEHSERNKMVQAENLDSATEMIDGRIELEFTDGTEFRVGQEGTKTPGATIVESSQ